MWPCSILLQSKQFGWVFRKGIYGHLFQFPPTKGKVNGKGYGEGKGVIKVEGEVEGEGKGWGQVKGWGENGVEGLG